MVEETRMKETFIRNYDNLKGKYLQQRDLVDCLLQPFVGSADWRNHLKFGDQVGKMKPALPRIFTRSLPSLPAKIFDWGWNRIDQTQYLAWSVYHYGWEWLTQPDKYGFGAFNVGWQDYPGVTLREKDSGGTLEGAFASWDDPQLYISFPLEHDYALLMRFWRYVSVDKQFEPTGRAVLLEWEEAPGGGTDTWTMVLDVDGEDFTNLIETSEAATPHQQEEGISFTMAFWETAWRKGFDESTYVPQWKVSGAKTKRPQSERDPGNVKLFTDADLQAMDIAALQKAWEALWQKYLAVKVGASYALHYYADHPKFERPDCSKIYTNFYMPKP